MKVTIFHAGDGDCLLVSSGDAVPRHMLVDGGRSATFAEHTRGHLAQLPAAEKLDIVCVSHIDDDHISGILRMVEDEVDWRAFEFARSEDPSIRPPRVERPPEISEIWHNGLFRLVGDDLAPVVESVLSTVATVLAGAGRAELRDLASELDDIVTGERSSMELSRRLSDRQLGIPLNPPTAGALLQRSANGAPAAHEQIALGALTIRLLGPSADDIARLRDDWQQWIAANSTALRRLQEEMLADEERLGTLSPRIVANPMIDQALGEGLSNVTAANLASLMFLVEEAGRTVLLTGDGVSSEILEGLDHHGRLDANGGIHVNVLKVQHHGAKANVEEDFVRRVTADHYVFCGNGAHHNPEIEVVEAFANARLRGIGGSGPVGPPTPFRFWFSSSPATPGLTDSRREHMQAVKDAVARLRQGHTARMLAPKFLRTGSLAIDL